jgi:transglutaminase-like putative cysteine protease
MQSFEDKYTPQNTAGKVGKKTGRSRKKKIIPPYLRPIICPPDRASMKPWLRVLGYIARAAVIFVAVFGIVFFVLDALKLEAQDIKTPTGFVALVSLVSVAVFSAMRLSKYGRIAGSVVILGTGVWTVLYAGNIISFAEKVFLTVKNVVLTRLYNLGYYAVIKYMSEVAYTPPHTKEVCFKFGVALFTVLISLIFTFSILKKARLALPAVVSTLVLVVVFTYNISRSNWGVTLIITSFAGILVMAAYDRIFVKNPNSKKYDTETLIFADADEDRPRIPDLPKSRKEIRREEKQRRREQKKQRKKEKRPKSVDEELTEYFGSSKKPKAARKEKKKKLTPEEKKALLAERREIKRQIRAVKEYDRVIADTRLAQGGFAAFGAFVVMMLILLIPTLTITGNFKTIEVIDRRMEFYREYVTALLMGDDPILDLLGYQNDKSNFEPHSTDAVKQSFTGVRLFTVETQYNAAVYMRGWIGVDYKDGAWYAANDDQLGEYRELYGTTLDPAETMFNNFYSIMNPALIEARNFPQQYTSNTKYGFVVMQVNVRRVETKDALVYMPSFLRCDELTRARRAESKGLYEYGTDTPSEVTFVNYFDGLYTGRKFMKELEYASVANITTMKNSDWYRTVTDYIAEFNKGYLDAYNDIEKYAERKAKGRNASLDDAISQMFYEVPENLVSVVVDEVTGEKIISVRYPRGTGVYTYSAEGELISKKATDLKVETYIDPVTGEEQSYTIAFVPPDLPLAIRFQELMDISDKRELAYNYYYQHVYSNFVYDTYLGKSNSKVISDLFKTIKDSAIRIVREVDDEGNVSETEVLKDFSKAAERNSADAETYIQRHELIMEIVDYLKENYTYTLEPTRPTDENLDGTEIFLAVTKEGYCVQYASALTLLLREAGIPARYVEGFVASDFRRNYAEDAVGRYVSSVRDYNAHAWVEVWYDGIGWVQYEATPVYYNDLYVKETGESSGGVVRPWEPVEEYTEEEMLLESIQASIDLAALRIDNMRAELALLFGSREIQKSLDNIEALLNNFRDNHAKLSDYYAQNKDSAGYDGADFIAVLNSFAESLDTNVVETLNKQQVRIDGLKALNRIIWGSVVLILVVLALIAGGIVIGTLAKKAEQKRAKTAERVLAGDFTDEERRTLACSIIDWLTVLLAAYGSAPKKGEFRDEYAERLEAEYSDVFGRPVDSDTATDDKPSKRISDTDFKKIFAAIADEEFGFGMTREELCELAAFYRRMREAANERLGYLRRIKYHYFKWII